MLFGVAVVQRQVAIDVEIQIALQRSHAPAAVYAQALFSRHQIDLVGIHATQAFDVNRKIRREARTALCGGLPAGILHLVGTHQQIQIFGPDLALNDHPARDQIELFDVGGIQAAAANGNLAVAHIESAKRTIRPKLRLTGDQTGAPGIDKTATIAANPVGIGHHDIGTAASHFHIAMQLGSIAGHHFVENDACRHRAQLRIATDPSAQLGLGSCGTVIQDQSLRIDVELVILVARHATRAGRGNMHDRHPVLRRIQKRTLTGRRGGGRGQREAVSIRRQQGLADIKCNHYPRCQPHP